MEEKMDYQMYETKEEVPMEIDDDLSLTAAALKIKLSKAAHRHAFTPDVKVRHEKEISQQQDECPFIAALVQFNAVVTPFSSATSSASANSRFVSPHQHIVEASRPKSTNPKGQDRTTFYIDPEEFDKKMKNEFDDFFNNLLINKKINKSEYLKCEMYIMIKGKVKGCLRQSILGVLGPIQWIWAENPVFLVKGGEAVHYDFKNGITKITPRIPTRLGGPLTYYKPDNLQFICISVK